MLSTALAIASGLLLFASDHPLHWWPLQLVAFVPLLLGLQRQHHLRRRLWPLGSCMALACCGPQLLLVGFEPPIVVAVVAAVLQWSALAPILGRLIAGDSVLSALAAAAAVTMAELAVWHLVPMFGTAQCFALPLGSAPALVAFAAYTGLAGVVFAVIAGQALLVVLCSRRSLRPALGIVALVALAAGGDAARWTRPLSGQLRVAALGWASGAADAATIDAAFQRAATAGAVLLVTPEAGVDVGKDARTAQLARFAYLAGQHRLAAAIGVWHQPTDDNRIWFFAANGNLVGEYRKTHLVPMMEDYTAGDGTLATASLQGVRIGGLVCQDDNFTDLARAYAGAATQLIVVPTNDWAAIREFHLESTVFRAIECGLPIVRATSGGISALISPRGEVTARLDHTVAGTDLLVGDVTPGDAQPTPFARTGDWPMAVFAAVLLLAGWRRRAGRMP
jgi:apolipoprotein N-acyltransferase